MSSDQRYRNPKHNKDEASRRLQNTEVDNSETSKEQSEPKAQAVHEVLLEAKRIEKGNHWDSLYDQQNLKKKITSNIHLGKKGDRILLELIIWHNPRSSLDAVGSAWTDKAKTNADDDPEDFSGVGKPLLCWMLEDRDLFQFFIKTPSAAGGRDTFSKSMPIHLAIKEKRLDFLACFFGICCDPCAKGAKEKAQSALEAIDENDGDQNCVHLAMEQRIPFAPFLAAISSASALMKEDRQGFTPLHIAMGMADAPKQRIPNGPMLPGGPAGKAQGWEDAFKSERVLDEILKMDNLQDHVMPAILTTISSAGSSLFQDIQHPGLARIQHKIKRLIFQHVKKMPDISKALYGTIGDTKELCLDMSDFNQSSHNFETFVVKLTDLGAGVIQFEDTLFFVHLPDLNYVKQPCPHHAIHKLFHWLHYHKDVYTIKKLSIPDSTTNPLGDAFVERHILDVFNIEELDWRKLDVNLDIITGAPLTSGRAKERKCLTSLILYSSGNWSVLYHWISENGLAKLPQLREVCINIVHLNPADGHHDQQSRQRHLELATEYKRRLERDLEANKGKFGAESAFNFDYRLEVKVNAKWAYPIPHEPDEPTTEAIKHQFTSLLSSSINAFRDWEMADDGAREPDPGGREETSLETGTEAVEKMERRMQILRFQTFALAPREPEPSKDCRIKVAIIDNGADRIRAQFRDMIAKGQSYVKADLLGSDRSLPWWMVSDPHGTQMASLVGQTNAYCRLYIARVGKSRNDIQAGDAAKAIDWAIEQDVDIISISWTLRNDDKRLENAIKRASEAKTLVFCSTADQGTDSEAWPVGYKDYVLSVSATNRWGHLTDRTAGSEAVDIMIPGENIQAAGPTYIKSAPPTVSGSSVATALAAGIASLALLMLKTFNKHLGDVGTRRGDRGAMREFYTKKGMKRVFEKMGSNKAIQLSKLFPYDLKDEKKTLEMLAEKWNVRNFPDTQVE